MSDLRSFHGPNAGYVVGLYERFLQDPASVEEAWRAFFENAPPAVEANGPAAALGQSLTTRFPKAEVRRILAARELARAIRSRGHTAARLDPLGSEQEADPALTAETHGITEEELSSLPPDIVRGPTRESARSARDAVDRLRRIYSGTVGYEFTHIPSADERAWLRESVESGRYLTRLSAEEERALLQRLSEVEGFEKYLHRTFFGQKRFSIEGTDMMVPILDEIAANAARGGVRDLVIGMAHRGRLSVLTHVLQKPYELILVGFQGALKAATAEGTNPDVPSGDVKYHMGWQTVRRFGDSDIRLTLSPNPSHLEFVNPVVVGMTRAAQDDTELPGTPKLNRGRGLAVLIHGDAAFPGQGIVAETFNMSGLSGYTVGGTIHVIANNQVGFTTRPQEARSTRHASDLAKGFEIPVVHVNADDAEACLGVARLAQAYRERFHKDFVIDLVGYRRWGHNEGDEPTFTQPLMYETIRSHPTVREQWAARLVERNVVSAEQADGMLQATLDRIGQVQGTLGEHSRPGPVKLDPRPPRAEDVETGVPAEVLRELNESLLARPGGFTPHARLEKQLERRRDALGPDGGIDWGQAESLAFASLLAEGIPIRMTGQDVERGTFSHRHLVLHDSVTGDKLNLLAELPQARASFEIYNSPLSEMAIVGFEYGYGVFDPQALVLWEAQFGDFMNGAQVMIDQYLSASYQKWGQSSGLVLLLPHGYEGQGPEHSSARLERFLQLCAQNNMRVANCTTSAQYFHLLRRQATLLRSDARPLILMSPKSLLRHPMAASRLEQLSNGMFHPVLVEEDGREVAASATRLLLCSGKVYVDLMAAEARGAAEHVLLARVEELYPFPAGPLRSLIESMPLLQEVVWAQEEPRNMGAWSYMALRLKGLLPGGIELRYEGRPERASPAEGSSERHRMEQDRIVTAAWSGASAPVKQRRARRA
jgi:2-oxoglutarate dehydrogenase E1 component